MSDVSVSAVSTVPATGGWDQSDVHPDTLGASDAQDPRETNHKAESRFPFRERTVL